MTIRGCFVLDACQSSLVRGHVTGRTGKHPGNVWTQLSASPAPSVSAGAWVRGRGGGRSPTYPEGAAEASGARGGYGGITPGSASVAARAEAVSRQTLSADLSGEGAAPRADPPGPEVARAAVPTPGLTIVRWPSAYSRDERASRTLCALRRELGGGLPASCGPGGAMGSGYPWDTCLGWVRVHPTPPTAVGPQRQEQGKTRPPEGA